MKYPINDFYMLKKSIISVSCAVALGAFAVPAFAAQKFFLVVPLKAPAQAPVESIAVSLTGSALPSAKVGQAYSESLRPYLQVTGDASYDASSARWSIVTGALPDGLSLDAVTGMVTGTPTAATTTPASFTVQVSYKAKDGQAVYNVDVAANIVVTLAGAELPKATINKPYNESLRAKLSVTGDAAFDIEATRWTVAEGTLPAGLALDETTGAVAGTPTAKTSSPASFTVLATYKGADGQAIYTIEVGGQVIQVRQLSAGGSHSCAITLEGGVKCWGSNGYGQLGNGTQTRSLVPTQVTGLTSGIASISAGVQHTCALTTDGAAKCWGYNDYGQVGDGSTSNRKVPSQVSGMTSGIAAISAGENHTCAVTSGGAAKCWGMNLFYQLGDGSMMNRSAPVQVSGLSTGVAAVAVGGSHTCALTTGGGVKCWGDDQTGQLGNDATMSGKTSPVNVLGLTSGVVSISASNHTCALTDAGAVKCWGFNAYGQVGDNSTTSRSTPVTVSGLASGVVSVAAGGNSTCAILATGGLKCWGFNTNGEVGDGTTTHRKTPVDVVGLQSEVTSVSTGGGFACAVHDGAPKCWGGRGNGELGNNSTNKSLVPVEVQGFQ